MKYILDIILIAIIGYAIYLAQSTNELIGNVRARLTHEPKAPVVYIIAEVKDPKKVCKSEVMWCYVLNETLKCDIDEKKLPNNVTHLKVCTVK